MGVCVVNFFLEEINVKPCTFTGMGALSQSGDESLRALGPAWASFLPAPLPTSSLAHFNRLQSTI
jgi:hypothetical protein